MLIARKKRAKCSSLHKHYPFVPTIMQNVLLNVHVPLFLESRYPTKWVFTCTIKVHIKKLNISQKQIDPCI